MAGVIAGVIVAVLLGFILYSSSPTITITDDILRVGRAAIEREHVGVAEGFRGEASRVISGPELDGRAFMCFRGWIEPKVRIQITDKADPTPYWIASTRHPERIVEILNENIGNSELERYQQEMQREHEQRMLLTHEARSQAQES
ncbi:hypothetical protein GCM10009794_00170 [Rothia terrae]